MKILFSILVILVLQISSNAQEKNFTVAADIQNLPDIMMYLIKCETPDIDKTKWKILDSSMAANAHVLFDGIVPETDYYVITPDGRNWCSFILSNSSNIQIKGKFDNLLYANVNGTKENKIYKDYIKKQDRLIPLLNSSVDSAESASAKNDTTKYNYYAGINQNMQDSIKKLQVSFIKEYPTTFFSISQMKNRYKDFSKIELADYYNSLPKDLKSSTIAKQLYYRVFEEDSILGNMKSFYNLNLYDTSGKLVSMKTFKGKYVLLDFWASWCKPCRENITKLKSLNETVNSDISFVGVSLDTNKEDWLQAIKKDGADWLQITDFKGFESIPAKYYNINAIPRYIIIDPSGKVAALNIKIDDINEALKKLSL